MVISYLFVVVELVELVVVVVDFQILMRMNIVDEVVFVVVVIVVMVVILLNFLFQMNLDLD